MPKSAADEVIAKLEATLEASDCSQGWEPPCSRPEHRPRGWCSWCSRRRAAIGSRAAGGAVEVLGVGELSSAHGSCNARRCSGI